MAVAAPRENALLVACLQSLVDQCRALGAEIVVARLESWRDLADLEMRFPAVRFVGMGEGVSLPQLRAAALSQAKGAIIALTEDHCVAGEDWLSGLVSVIDGGADVCGGAMGNAQRQRAVDCGAFFSEYGFFSRQEEEAQPLITGANVAYGPHVVEDVRRMMARGEWENIVHDALLRQGRVLAFNSKAVIYQNMSYRFCHFVKDRYQHGRDYARRRLDDQGARRWVYLVGALALPVLLTWRVGRKTAEGDRGDFIRALPFTFSFFAAWAAGEAIGYWLGPNRKDS